MFVKTSNKMYLVSKVAQVKAEWRQKSVEAQKMLDRVNICVNNNVRYGDSIRWDYYQEIFTQYLQTYIPMSVWCFT